MHFSGEGECYTQLPKISSRPAGRIGFGKNLNTALPRAWAVSIRHSTALPERMQPDQSLHCAQAKQACRLETLLQSHLGLTRSTDVPH